MPKSLKPSEPTKHQLDVQQVVPDAAAAVERIRGTPTLVVVGPDGVIENVWLGMVDPVVEREILSHLAT